ncbi:MAG TPA: EamA family transporter [Rhizomicrobium sp.]|nr:EamA family transporter [Rhizomicrobium sp.]
MSNKQTHLPIAHILLATMVALVWGSNFVVIKIALAHLPPLLFAALRFTFAFLPAAFFIPRPAVPWRNLAAYGLLIGAGQFGLLYIAMKGSISPGSASLVIQLQVFFTIALAAHLTSERLHAFQGVALVLAAVGLALIAMHGGSDATPLGLCLTVLAALCWASGNIVARASGGAGMLGYVVWSSLFAIPPLIALSLVFEGRTAIAQGLSSADATTWAAVLYQSFGNTLLGYGSWAYLLARHPAATISPFALLVPVVGLASSALLTGEPLQSWKLAAAGLVLSGLALNLVWASLVRWQGSR